MAPDFATRDRLTPASAQVPGIDKNGDSIHGSSANKMALAA
jgi:hypothetical protein